MRLDLIGRLAGLGLLLCLLAVPATAGIAVIETQSGQTFEGELISEDDRTVVLLISGIETPVKRSAIKTMTLKKSALDIYRERRAELKDADLEGRFDLAFDMYEMEAYDLALRETSDLRDRFPDAKNVERLHGVVEEAIELETDRENREAGDDQPKPDDAQGNANQPDPQEDAPQNIRDRQLSDEAINLIRLWELPADEKELRELKPRIIIPRAAITDLFNDFADKEGVPKGRREQDAFRRLDGWQQVGKFFEVRARELYPEIRVVEDPPTMLAFRRLVYPRYINTYFAPTFGSGAVDGLILFGGKGDKARSAYTDFYILHKYEDGFQRMIDRDKPAESLLLQWGLPRDQAKFPAPDVPGWRPFFTRGVEDEQYQKVAEWIGKLYTSPDYGIDYAPPKQPQ